MSENLPLSEHEALCQETMAAEQANYESAEKVRQLGPGGVVLFTGSAIITAFFGAKAGIAIQEHHFGAGGGEAASALLAAGVSLKMRQLLHRHSDF